MKRTIWRPEPKDKKVNKYLDKVNHEPWLMATVIGLLVISLMTFLIVAGIF